MTQGFQDQYPNPRQDGVRYRPMRLVNSAERSCSVKSVISSKKSSASACLPSRSRAADMRESANERKRFIDPEWEDKAIYREGCLLYTSVDEYGLYLGGIFQPVQD